VVNTHWHADHVGGNGLLQATGAGIAASAPDAKAVARRDPGCCQAEHLDRPVSPYTIDEPLHDGQILRLGDADWQVIRTPGHTPGHLSLWQPEERLLVVGDALSDYDVGWVNLALDGPQAAATALASLHRLADLAPQVLLPAHGPIPADPGAAFATALGRAQRLVDDPAGAVWHGARRIFAFALMIRDGIPTDEVEPYLHARAWLADAARLLSRTPETLAAELVAAMLALSFHLALLGPTGAHWLDDPSDVSRKDSTRQHAVDDPRLSCKQQVGVESPRQLATRPVPRPGPAARPAVGLLWPTRRTLGGWWGNRPRTSRRRWPPP
jgi:glyoxylase-like metal-dependent hydrolase (beta-lactamase superfamily II)